MDESLNLVFTDFRGVPKSLHEKYNVLTGVDDKGEPKTRVYPYPHRPKLRILPKDFSQNKGFTNDHLLGADCFNAGSSQKITIVEGEEDWLAAIFMLGDKWPVVALPGANTTRKVLTKFYDYLNSFDKIIICTDGDRGGDQTARDLVRSFPGKCYRVQLTKHKDPSDYLTKGDKKEFFFSWANAVKFVPQNILNTPDQFLSLYTDSPDLAYTPTGIHALDDVVVGLMQGHFTVIKAQTGIGKTEFMRYLEYSMLKQKVPIAAWHLEETAQRSLLGLVSYQVGDNVTRRDIIEAKGKDEEVRQGIKDLTSDENFFQFSLEEDEGADELCEQITKFATVWDCKYVFFEPIQDVISASTDEGKEAALASLSVRLSRLAAQLGIGIVTIAHTNDQGDTKYCKMISQRASVLINLSRDKTSLNPDEVNTTHISVEKNRPSATVGPAGSMVFDIDTFTMEESITP